MCRGRGLVCFSTHSADCRGKPRRSAKSAKRLFLVVLLPLVPYGTPSGGSDDRPLGGEHAVPCRERDGGSVLEATGGEGFEQAGGYHVVYRALVGGQLAGQTLGDDERMVVGDFPCVHTAAVARSPFQGGGMGGESRVPLQQGDTIGYLVEHVVR